MSYSQFMDIANSVMAEAIHATNYNSHNTNSTHYSPVAFGYTDLQDRAPETYVYPYGDVFNPFVMLEGTDESFTSHMYKLINPETYDPSMLLTNQGTGSPYTITNYEAAEKFLTTHPAASLDANGIIIDGTA